RYPEGPVAEKRDRGKGIAAEIAEQSGQHLRAAAEGKRHCQDQGKTFLAEDACVDHAEQPGRGGESNQPERCRIGQLTFHLGFSSYELYYVLEIRECAARQYRCKSIPGASPQ